MTPLDFGTPLDEDTILHELQAHITYAEGADLPQFRCELYDANGVYAIVYYRTHKLHPTDATIACNTAMLFFTQNGRLPSWITDNPQLRLRKD